MRPAKRVRHTALPNQYKRESTCHCSHHFEADHPSTQYMGVIRLQTPSVFQYTPTLRAEAHDAVLQQFL